jgi:hypothetical protein
LYDFPGFALRLTAWDLIGTASYVLAFALLESAAVAAPFVLLAAILPAKFREEHYVALSSAVIIISSVWMAYANYHLIDFSAPGLKALLPEFVLYLISIVLPIALILRSRRIERAIQAILQRVAALVLVYAAFGCLGVVIVVIRNL